MASINLGSELIETLLTPAEKNVAMQLMDKNLSIAYLQNSKVGIFRELAMQEFTDPNKDSENHRLRAYWKGQLDLLEALIAGALSPDPVPLTDGTDSSSLPSQG